MLIVIDTKTSNVRIEGHLGVTQDDIKKAQQLFSNGMNCLDDYEETTGEDRKLKIQEKIDSLLDEINLINKSK